MSYIAIHVYNGDHEEFTDSELDAAAIAGYVAERKHFDVRVWTN